MQSHDADLASIRSETLLMTPKAARALRDSATFERQRAINREHVLELAEEMRQRWFIPGTPLYVGVLPDGKQVLLNGNHTCEAIVEAGIPVAVTVIYKQVADMQEAARIYMNHDVHRTRNWRDALQASEGVATEFEGRALAALGHVMVGFDDKIVSPAQASPNWKSRTARFDLLKKFDEPVKTLFAATNAGGNSTKRNNRLMFRVGIMAVALVTTRDQPEHAVRFWGGFVRDDGLRASDPRKALLNFAIGTMGLAQSWAARHFQSKGTALAWNAFWREESLTWIKPVAMKNFRLLGTEFHKGPRSPRQQQAEPADLLTMPGPPRRRHRKTEGDQAAA